MCKKCCLLNCFVLLVCFLFRFRSIFIKFQYRTQTPSNPRHLA